MKLAPPAWAVILALCMWAADTYYPIYEFRAPWFEGPALIILSFFVFMWTGHLFKTHRTSIRPSHKPSKLITEGPYEYSRNPIYLAFAVGLIGLGLILGSVVCIIFPLLFLLIMQLLFIPMEEKNLEKAIGKPYVEYKQKVRRWL